MIVNLKKYDTTFFIQLGFLFSLLCVAKCGGNKVLELSDRFLEVKQEGAWLVKFYAPWCGHCKKLEPVWQQVAQALYNTDIRVGRVDCTKFTNVATEFGVRGFPTILFMKGSKIQEYKGDRTKKDLVQFAKRLDGPTVRHVTDCKEFDAVLKEKRPFFVFISVDATEETVALKKMYSDHADDYQAVADFYTTMISCAPKVKIQNPNETTVYVVKDDAAYPFAMPETNNPDQINETLREWINDERFPTFARITNGNFHLLLRTKKHLVMAVTEENVIGKMSMKMEEFKETLEAIAKNNRDLYHKHFLFGYLAQPDVANSVAMQTLKVPSLIVVNPTTYQYYLPKLTKKEKVPAPQSIIKLLDQILKHNATAYGGDSTFHRVYRVYYEATTTLAGMWKGNPVLTALLFGLPLGFLSIICYTSCCSDILEASEEDEPVIRETSKEEDENEESHEKKE